MEEQFVLYLLKIGLLQDKMKNKFFNKKIYQSNRSDNFFESIFPYLMNYFDNLSIDNKKFMSYWIPIKFIENRRKTIKDKLKPFIFRKALNNKLILLKYFYYWRQPNLIPTKNKYIRRRESRDKKNNHLEIHKIMDNDDENSIIINKDNNTNSYIINQKNFSGSIRIPLAELIQHNSNYNDIINIKNKNISKGKNKKIDYNTFYNNKKISTNNSIKNIKQNSLLTNKNKFKENYNTTYFKTTLAKKEEEELNECTFHPKINKSNKFLRNKMKNMIDKDSRENDKFNSQHNIFSDKILQRHFDKLYNDNEKYRLAKEIKAIEYEQLMNMESTFTPNLSTASLKFRNKRNESFNERQKYFQSQKEMKNKNLKDQIDSNFDNICSFVPNISESNNLGGTLKQNKGNHVYKRLFNDYQKRKEAKEKREIDYNNQINLLANSPNKNKEGKVSYEKINMLYLNKEKNDIYRKTKKKVEDEEGITFKPYVTNYEFKKNMEGNFYERNLQFLKDKENYRNEQIMKQEQAKKDNDVCKGYTKNERDEIVKNIINRLYNESSIGKNSHCLKASCNSFNKSGKSSSNKNTIVASND